MAKNMERCLDLSIGQPDFEIPYNLRQKAISAIESSQNAYTPSVGIESARISVREKYEIRNRSEYDVILTSGVSGGLLLSFAAILDEGDEILIPDPYFVGYKEIPVLLGAKPVPFNTYPSFVPSVDQIDRVITKRTKAIVIGSPSNPTGVTLSQDQIDRISVYAKEKGIFLVFDEIYEMFSYDSAHTRPKLDEHVIILNGLSKSHAMTGWRLGWAVCNSSLIDEMQKLQQFTYVCAPSPFQHVISDALISLDDNIFSSYKNKRDRLVSALAQKYDFQNPGGAFYVFPKANDKTGESFVEKCIARSLLVIPGSVFSTVDSHFRISFAVKDDVLDEAISVLLSL